MRVTVGMIVGLVASGYNNREILEMYPYLEAEDIEEALHYAAWRVARKKLVILDAVSGLNDLRIPPGNQLEALTGDRKGQHSIRINDQWRICFKWTDGDAYHVEITDYH